MPIQHPEFCDPRLCETDPGTSVEHRDTPLTWKPAGDDAELTVGITQYDCLDFGLESGPVKVLLGVTSIVASADSRLTPADARMLGAALVSWAERAEALNRRGDR